MSFLKQITTDNVTGKYSSSKVWYTISNVVATYIILRLTLKDQLTIDFFLAYMGIVGGYAAASKFMSLKFQGQQQPPAPTTEAIPDLEIKTLKKT